MKKIMLSFFILILFANWQPGASQPRLKWMFPAESQLYAPPLIADVAPTPGSEIILSDSEVRKIRCISAGGEALWEFSAGWKKRQPGAASVTWSTPDGAPRLVIGNGDGVLVCLHAATGQELWRQEIGGITWGTAIWADLDGDGQDEIIAGTEKSGILALDAHGSVRWHFDDAAGKSLFIEGPIAAADLDDDGRSEIFAVNRSGPFCLNSTGVLRWQQPTGDEFKSAPAIADADGDGRPELYCTSSEDAAVHAFDALTGERLWTCPMSAGGDIYSGSSIAIGDIDQDGFEEIIASNEAGYVHCMGWDGVPRWVFSTEKRVHAAASLGDVDGDGAIDVLAASGDHFLYCLDCSGCLKWRTPAELRLIYSPGIADVDNDGKTDILVCGSDRKLRCFTTDARFNPDLVPWPSRRYDAAQSASSFRKPNLRDLKALWLRTSLLEYGDFEQEKTTRPKTDYVQDTLLYRTRKARPRGWIQQTASGDWQLDRNVSFSGSASVKVIPGEHEFLLGSEEIGITHELIALDARLRGRGAGAAGAFVCWSGSQSVLRMDSLKQLRHADKGWKVFEIDSLKPPRNVRWVKLVCISRNVDAAPVWWDAAEMPGSFKVMRQLRALVNQLGYEPGAPKRFTVQCNFPAATGQFVLLDEKGAPVFHSSLEYQGRIKGAFGHDWGGNYWRGDFTAFDVPGSYRLKVTLDGASDLSWPFDVAANLYWERTARLAYRFFTYQRCGMEIPGFHKACHLDDATNEAHTRQYDLAGGWHDAGDYNKYHNAPYVYGLASAYALQKSRFDLQDADQNGVSDFWDEVLWGGDFSRRMIMPDGSVGGSLTSGWGFFGAPEQETDNQPNTGDERVLQGQASGGNSAMQTAACAKIACYTDEKLKFIEAADRGLSWALKNNHREPLQLSAAIDLFVATGKKNYENLAKELFQEVGLKDIAIAIEYDRVFETDHSRQIREALVKEAEKLLSWAQNPFGVCTYGPEENPNFFGTPASEYKFELGSNSYLLESATKVALAYQYEPQPRYLAFIYDQFNWIFGNNPFDLCMLEGCGSTNPPTYHHRYFLAGVPRGAVPGSVVNGIFWRAIGDDRPRFDLSGVDIPYYASNECWLPHNTHYMQALVNLQLIHDGKSRR